MKIVSWNVNGIVACRRKGFLKFLADTKPDIVFCQEIKTQCPLATPGYTQYWNPAERPGYSGTLSLTKHEPLSVTFGLGVEKFDVEGRLITLEYKDFYVVNIYAPSLNPHSAPERLEFRIAWDKALQSYVSKLQKPVILCGDFNATRGHIDSYPDNGKIESDAPLFSSASREGFDELLSIGLVDAFRVLHPRKEGAYTWWGPKNKNQAEKRDFCICDSWLTQGYEVKALHLVEQRIVFRRTENYTTGLVVPKKLTEWKLPDAAVYECERFFGYIIQKYGL